MEEHHEHACLMNGQEIVDEESLNRMLERYKQIPEKARKNAHKLRRFDVECRLKGDAVVRARYRGKKNKKKVFEVELCITPDQPTNKVRSLTCTCPAGADIENCCKHAMTTAMYLKKKTVGDLNVDDSWRSVIRSEKEDCMFPLIGFIKRRRRSSQAPVKVKAIHKSDDSSIPDAGVAVLPEYVKSDVDGGLLRPIVSKVGENDNSYCMDHNERGVALIFNHEKFEERTEDGKPKPTKYNRRNGTNKDCDDLCSCLRDYGFKDIRVVPDGTTEQVMDTMRRVSEEDHTDRDCIVVVVLSHGRQLHGHQMIVTRDREYAALDLLSFIDASRCPSLANKPKMFFIQACQGTQRNQPVTIYHTVSHEAEDEDITDSQNSQFDIPCMSDFLVVNATIPGYYAWRNGERGSWFVQALCAELRNNLELGDSFEVVIRKVRMRVSRDYKSSRDGTLQMQMPCITYNSLRREVLLTPKARPITQPQLQDVDQARTGPPGLPGKTQVAPPGKVHGLGGRTRRSWPAHHEALSEIGQLAVAALPGAAVMTKDLQIPVDEAPPPPDSLLPRRLKAFFGQRRNSKSAPGEE